VAVRIWTTNLRCGRCGRELSLFNVCPRCDRSTLLLYVTWAGFGVVLIPLLMATGTAIWDHRREYSSFIAGLDTQNFISQYQTLLKTSTSAAKSLPIAAAGLLGLAIAFVLPVVARFNKGLAVVVTFLGYFVVAAVGLSSIILYEGLQDTPAKGFEGIWQLFH
jgi:hypothetical protein